MVNFQRKHFAIKPVVVAAASLALMMLGCAEINPPKNVATAPPKPVNKYKQAKLLVQKEPKGSTGVYHQHFKISSPLSVNGSLASGDHSFELTNTANFKGDQPRCVSKATALLINHSTPSQATWHFPPFAKFAFVADGESFKPEKVIQSPPEFEDGEYWETLIIQPPCEMYAKLSKASTVEIKMGDGSIKLTPDEITDYQRFTAAIGFK
jgi:hypothetical protein